MIAGETEYVIQGKNGQYDTFLKGVFKKNPAKRNRPKSKLAKKEKRQAWWGKQKQGFQDAGGIEGVASTVGNVLGWFKQGDVPENYDVNVGATEEEETSEFPTTLLYVGGALTALVIGGLVLSAMNKNKQVQAITPQMQSAI